MGFGDGGSNSGGLFKGPILTKVEKSIKVAQEGGKGRSVEARRGVVQSAMPSKQKIREKTEELNGGPTILRGPRKKRVDEIEDKGEVHVVTRGGSLGAGVAEVGFQPR
jgi:hypothetical protein